MKTGWQNDYEYFVVKPLKNGNHQQLVMGARKVCGRWYIMMGIFSSNCTYNTMIHSIAWIDTMSTNKKPSIKVASLALEALKEVEEEIHNRANGKRTYIYVDGMDERRLRVYTKVLTKKCGYKKSTAPSRNCDLPLIYKRV